MGVFVVGWVDMDGKDLKILSSPIERDSSINKDSDMVGFLGRILDKIHDRVVSVLLLDQSGNHMDYGRGVDQH